MRVNGTLVVGLRCRKMKLHEQRSSQTQILQHPRGGMGFIERIEMQAGYASLEKFRALLRGVVDTKCRRGLVITFQSVQTLSQRRRDARAAHGGKLLDLGCGQNWDNARANRDRDTKLV